MYAHRIIGVLLVAAIMVGAASFASAEEIPAMNLENLLQQAFANNPKIQAAQKNLQAAQALMPQAWGLDDPMLLLENDNARRNPFDGQEADQNRIGFSQKIPFPAKFFARSAAVSKEIAASKAQAEQAITEVMRDVKKAYSDLYLAMRTKELLEESRQALDSFRDAASRKYSLGNATQADVLGAEVERAKVLNDLTVKESQIIIAQAGLKALLNRSDVGDFVIPTRQELLPMAKTVEELLAEAQNSNPSLRDAQAQMGKAQANLTLAKLEYAPDVEIKTEFRQIDGGPDVWDGFLGVTIPLWAWKQQGKIREAKATLEGKQSALTVQKNEVIRAVREAYARVQSAWHVANNLITVIIPQSEQTVKVSEAAYENDKIDFNTLITYWRYALNYRMEMVQATAEYEQALADLQWAIGEVQNDNK